MSDMIKVHIVDDHAIFRLGLVELIESESDMSVVGQSADGAALLDDIPTTQPDVILMDIEMPKINGIKAIEMLYLKGFLQPTIILTILNDNLTVLRALNAGVKGYLLKENAEQEVVQAIRNVYKGKVHITQECVAAALNKESTDTRGNGSVESKLASLSRMERQVLSRLCSGLTSVDIGKELFISPRTVQKHRQNIGVKLNLPGRNQLAAFAAAHREELEKYTTATP
jgi:DNA-binding NarL/FixJ family response regulator